MAKIFRFSWVFYVGLCFGDTIQQERNDLEPIPYIDFDVSMQRSRFEDFLQKNNNMLIYDVFRNLYMITNPLVVPTGDILRIPKKLHFIWLGRPMPEEFYNYINSWREFHPDWEFKLWTEADLPTFDFKNRDLFDEARNFSKKADIWCLEILEQCGGLYLNIDFQCLRRMDTLHYTYDFYIAMQPLDTNIVQIGTGLIAAAPGHPLIRYCREKIRETAHIEQIIVATGPVFFTRAYVQYCASCSPRLSQRDVVFPASYFYPCGYTQRGQPPEVWYKDEARLAYGVHHWAGSWLGKEAWAPKQ